MAGTGKHRRAWTYGSSSVLSTLFLIGILALLALIAERHPWRVDMTESGTFTLSEQTRNILGSLDQTIEIKAFFATAAPEQTKAKDLLETYRYASDKITFDFIDPDRQPDMARRYDIRSYGTLVLEGYGRKQTIPGADEESITNALLRLGRNEQKKVYFLTGHGEHSTEKSDKEGFSAVREALEKDNYAVTGLNLLQQAKVPDDAAAVIVAGPQKALFPRELESLKSYLGRGGRLMVLLDPYGDAGFKAFLKDYGVELADDVVIDKLSRVFGGDYLMPVVMQYGAHRITANFELATFYPEARSVMPAKDPPRGVLVEPLASTSENAWAERNMEMLKGGEASFEEQEDILGPLPIIVLAEMDRTRTDQRESGAVTGEDGILEGDGNGTSSNPAFLIVAGDSDFATNTYFGLSGNGDLFLNMVNFLAEENNLITIKPREKSHQPTLMTQAQASITAPAVLVVMPLLVLLSGVAVYRARRSQR